MRVLMVEDEVRLAQSVARGLEADGFDVDVVHDGLDGLWRAREGSYAAIVLDIMLPGMNGYEVCRTLRSEDIWTPVLFLTAKDGEYDETDGFEMGADDYLRKPFSHAVLVSRLRALTRRSLGSRPAVLTQGSLELDPATRRVSRAGTDISLTPREFSVLELFLRRSPDVVSKAELIDEVWGLDFDGDPNVAEVYVVYLRKKVDRPFGVESIQTVRGIGYRIVAP
ncbi:MAG: response regulator transcription factor [Actinobacteria bacterium]|nr:response regulator transcription factor [Actinomycetota bacterium]